LIAHQLGFAGVFFEDDSMLSLLHLNPASVSSSCWCFLEFWTFNLDQMIHFEIELELEAQDCSAILLNKTLDFYLDCGF